MTTYELIAYSTADDHDVRWRTYTTSRRKADRFMSVPSIQFSDSGHKIIFVAREHRGGHKPLIKHLLAHVRKFGGYP